MFNKRNFQWKSIVITGLFSFIILGGNFIAYTNAAEPTAFSTWGRTARIGGAAVWQGMTDAEMNTLLNNLATQNVSVIEADSDLSTYLTDAEFNQELALITTFSQKAHAHANKFKVVWYYPALEALTANVANTTHSMAKDHPDWVQKGIDGSANVFVGGSGQVFWVDPGMESAWLSPSSPYRNYFFTRVSRIAKETGVDGLWADVPIYSDFGPVRWADANVDAVKEFETKYAGALTPPPSTPATGNWTDLSWRKWIVWRHEELSRFLADATAVARKDNPEFAFIVETLPTDYAMSTVYGLEGVDLRPIEGLSHVWEVDTLSNTSGMRMAREDDWISYISMQKYIKAASGNKPAWSFAYGKEANDAELVMAEILASGNNPYELKIPEMTTTVGAAYRTKMFGWIKANENLLWQNSSASVAVLSSPASRDFVDEAKGEGMYVTTTSGGDSLWWNDEPAQSAYQRQYIAEYRGMIKLLVHNHIPFDAVIKPPSVADLVKYQTLILPDVEALSDADAAIIRAYVNNGGHVIVTGPNPSGMNEYGTSRSEYALSDVFGINKGSALPASKVQSFGSGDSRFFSALLGKKYFTNAADAASAATSLLTAINQTSSSLLTSTANKKVHIELSNTADNDKYIVQYVNFIGVTGTFTVVPTTAPTTFKVPANKDVVSVELTSPDNATFVLSPLAYTKTGQNLTFTVPVTEYALAVVTLKDSGGGVNRPPVAVNDSLTTTANTPVNFTAAQLLVNDSDPDSNPLTISNISAPTHGTITGSYTYTPTTGYTGSDTFTYTISDGQGGTAIATVTVTISATPVNRPPVATNDSLTTTKDTAVNFTAAQLLANDTDPDNNPLSISSISATTAQGGTVSGSYIYTPKTGFTGTDSFTYTLSDGQGGTASATVNVTINAAGLTPKKYFPQAVSILTGKFDYGTMASFTAADSDTYDIKSIYVAARAGGETDWYGKTVMTGSPSALTQLTVTYKGQYSKTNVTQQFYLYNFTTNGWDLFDTRSVGNTTDVTVTATVSSNPQRYVSASGEIRARVKGFRAGAQSTTNWVFYNWANYLSWDVK